MTFDYYYRYFSVEESQASQVIASNTNIKCGSCKLPGHNRAWKKCPNYYKDDEMTRRNVS